MKKTLDDFTDDDKMGSPGQVLECNFSCFHNDIRNLIPIRKDIVREKNYY